MEILRTGDEAKTTKCLDCGQKSQIKKADRGREWKPSPLTHKTHHLCSLAKLLLQSYMAASQKECLQSFHRSRRPTDEYAEDIRIYWFKHSYCHLSRSYLAVWQCSIQYISITLLCCYQALHILMKQARCKNLPPTKTKSNVAARFLFQQY